MDLKHEFVEHRVQDNERFTAINERLTSIDAKLDPIVAFFKTGRSYKRAFLTILVGLPMLASAVTGTITLWQVFHDFARR